MGIRADLAAGLVAVLPDTIRIIDHPRDIDRIDGSTLGVVMLTRTAFEPSTRHGSHVEVFSLDVIEPTVDQEGRSEDRLDSLAHQVRDALDAATWLTWSKATRSTYAEVYPAYQFDIRLITNTQE